MNQYLCYRYPCLFQVDLHLKDSKNSHLTHSLKFHRFDQIPGAHFVLGVISYIANHSVDQFVETRIFKGHASKSSLFGKIFDFCHSSADNQLIKSLESQGFLHRRSLYLCSHCSQGFQFPGKLRLNCHLRIQCYFFLSPLFPIIFISTFLTPPSFFAHLPSS